MKKGTWTTDNWGNEGRCTKVKFDDGATIIMLQGGRGENANDQWFVDLERFPHMKIIALQCVRALWWTKEAIRKNPGVWAQMHLSNLLPRGISVMNQTDVEKNTVYVTVASNVEMSGEMPDLKEIR